MTSDDLSAKMRALLPVNQRGTTPPLSEPDPEPVEQGPQVPRWVPDEGEGIPEQPDMPHSPTDSEHLYESLMIGAQVRAVRDVLSLTAREMASLMGTSTRTLQRMSVPSAIISTPMVRAISELICEIDRLRGLIVELADEYGNIALHRHGWRQLPESGRWISEALWVQLVGEVWRAEVVAAGGIEHMPWSPVMELD